MKIVLLSDIKGLGKRGDVKEIKSGYARNFLLPKGLAKIATKDAVDTVTAEKIESAKEARGLERTLEEIQKDTSELPLAFSVKTGKEGEVFSSVMAEDIKNELIKRYPALNPIRNRPASNGAEIKVKDDHIKELGKRTVTIDLGQGIEGEITINIEPEK